MFFLCILFLRILNAEVASISIFRQASRNFKSGGTVVFEKPMNKQNPDSFWSYRDSFVIATDTNHGATDTGVHVGQSSDTNFQFFAAVSSCDSK